MDLAIGMRRQSKRSYALRVARLAAVVWMATTGTAWSQLPEFHKINPLAPDRRGVRLYRISIYSSYYSSAMPSVFASSGNGGAPSLVDAWRGGSDAASGVSAELGWSGGKKSSFALEYGFFFNGSVRYPEWNSINHHLSFRAGRPLQLARKLTLGYSGTTELNTFQNFIFSPTNAAALAGTPATSSDLIGAALQHPPTNDQLAATTGGVAPVDSSLVNLFYGNRVLNLGAQVGLSYSLSPRTNLFVSVAANRLQPIRFNDRSGSSTQSGGNASTAPAYAYSLGQGNSISILLGMSRLVTPRTTLSIAVGSSRNLSRLGDQVTTNGILSITRAMGRHWFLQGRAGSGDLQRLRSVFGGSGGIGWQAGASFGTVLGKHTLIFSADRTLGDSWGLGVDSNITTSGAWSLRISRKWETFASYNQQQLRSGVIDTINGWRAACGLAHALSSTLFVDLRYGYFANSGRYTGAAYRFASNGARISVTWAPAGVLAAARARDSGFEQ